MRTGVGGGGIFELERKGQETGENCMIIRDFMVCTLHQTLG
jgi:hypothetical protein